VEKRWITTGVSEARSRERRGKKTPTLHLVTERGQRRSRITEARRSGLGRRETSCPPVTQYGALVSVEHPRCESGESEPGTHEVRVHAVRLGGRSWLDASRVLFAGRSQGLLAEEGASQEEVRNTA